ncbi:MAG: tubulin-like doman-containing protein, partial [Trebonia sp.]
MFVGLGGTGCDVGAELERTMREEICGADGNSFRKRPGMDGLLPYQLPSCIQFVYADVNQSELERLRGRVVSGAEHIPAVEQTAHYVSDLVPAADSYPDLARNLRMRAGRETVTWLPGDKGEPRVVPLHFGAGQFPTVGRAAIFGRFLEGGIATAVRDVNTAIGKLSAAGTELHLLGGEAVRGVDVFVAFSVAGGTGCGIFYDYLHLIGDALNKTDLKVKLYPLVLMPSAFEDGLGGGRAAQLNAGRALLDLFRLIDHQNAAPARLNLDGMAARRPVDPGDVAVHYPGQPRIALDPGTVQTGFLFSRPPAASREDMHRAMVSLVMSLIGTEVTQADHHSGVVPQSFADSWVNQAGLRDSPAENGIGNRGVSTALVASLTVPVDDLAGIVSARLLRGAIEQLSRPVTTVESNRAEREEFLIKAGVHQIVRPQVAAFHEPQPVRGAREVAAALADRLVQMGHGIDSLRAQLSRDIPELANNFHPEGAIDEMLAKTDVFKVERVLFGHRELREEADKGGVKGLLNFRRAAPPPPDGSPAAPGIPELRDRFPMRKVEWTEEEPVACRKQQDAWYQWQTYGEWAKFWEAYAPQWGRALDRAERNLTALTKELVKFARDDHEDFENRSAELYKRRVGVSYMLPASAGQMEQFYDQVIARLRQHRYREGRARAAASEPDLLLTMLSADSWRQTYKLSVEFGPQTAVSFLLEQVKTAVRTFLREPPAGEQPMLPKLADLLSEAAGRATDSGITQEYLDQFKGKLAGLLPAGFTPQGSGPLKVLVSYPAGAREPIIEGHLKKAISLPAGVHDFRNTGAESISVVLFRTAMGITEVGEVRDVLRLWADALTNPHTGDRLRWRQRTGYDFSYLATNEEHRVQILHHILSALWNGRGAIQGPVASPSEFSITLDGGVTMPLPLRSFGQA